jgi:mediator of RNA polymerase II transcription subunit 7
VKPQADPCADQRDPGLWVEPRMRFDHPHRCFTTYPEGIYEPLCTIAGRRLHEIIATMADEAQQQPQQDKQELDLKTIWPVPPPFYKHFTKANVAELRRRRKEAGVLHDTNDPDTGDDKRGIDILNLPPELRYLIPPPPPPPSEPFHVFGQSHLLNAPPHTLNDPDLAGKVEKLYPDVDAVRLNPKPYLLSLAKSQLTTFLALVGTLSQNAEKYEDLTKDLEIIAYNMHDLINRYRPHQARETLILMMEERVERVRAETRAIRQAKERVGKLVGAARQDGEQEMADAGTEQPQDVGDKGGVVKKDVKGGGAKARQRAAWAALEQAMRDDTGS